MDTKKNYSGIRDSSGAETEAVIKLIDGNTIPFISSVPEGRDRRDERRAAAGVLTSG